MRFFGKQFESNGEKRRIWRTTRNVSFSACYRETNHYSPSSIDVLYYPEERDGKG